MSSSVKLVKVLRSHSAHSRFCAELEGVVGYLARVQVEEIPSPYAYSPTKAIYEWQGKKVIWFETAHRRYEVFEVLPQLLRFKTEDEATSWHIRFSRRRA